MHAELLPQIIPNDDYSHEIILFDTAQQCTYTQTRTSNGRDTLVSYAECSPYKYACFV